MSCIEWNLQLQEENEESNLYDPVGDIKILGDRGFVEEKDTYLDAFFEAFIEGANRMEAENIFSVDPLIEPNDILFHCDNNELEIEYRKQKALILNKNIFLENLQNAVADFLRESDKLAHNSNQPKRKLTKLRNFLLNK